MHMSGFIKQNIYTEQIPICILRIPLLCNYLQTTPTACVLESN